MQIESPKRVYRVIQRLMSETRETVFLCKENGREENKQYLVIEICDSSLAYSIIPMFLSWKEDKGFLDYIECFNSQGMLYLSFLYHPEKSLEEQMQKKQLVLTERLLIVKGILSNAILQSVPTPILWEVLQYQNILVADDLTVNFDYLLLMMEVYQNITFRDVQDRFRELLCSMFTEELENRSLPELDPLLLRLKEYKYEQLIQIYQDYNELCTELLIKIKEGRVKPRRLWFTIWEFIKDVYQKIKIYIIALIVILLTLYFIHTLVNRSNDAKEKTVFYYIGNVTIHTEK